MPKQIEPFTNFNSGEFANNVAGRIDLDAFGSSTRKLSNFLSEVTGGIKKFYGTNHISTIDKSDNILLVPIVNKYEPMAVVFTEDVVGLITKTDYTVLTNLAPLGISDYTNIRYKQINDKIFFVSEEKAPFSLDFTSNGFGDYNFAINDVSFDEVPYFPLGWDGNYNGTITTNGSTGTLTVTATNAVSKLVFNLPSLMVNKTSANTLGENTYFATWYPYTGEEDIYKIVNASNNKPGAVTVSLHRIRSSVDTSIFTDGGKSSSLYCKQLEVSLSPLKVKIASTRFLKRSLLETSLKTFVTDCTIVDNSLIMDLPSTHATGDTYYLKVDIAKTELF